MDIGSFSDKKSLEILEKQLSTNIANLEAQHQAQVRHLERVLERRKQALHEDFGRRLNSLSHSARSRNH